MTRKRRTQAEIAADEARARAAEHDPAAEAFGVIVRALAGLSGEQRGSVMASITMYFKRDAVGWCLPPPGDFPELRVEKIPHTDPDDAPRNA